MADLYRPVSESGQHVMVGEHSVKHVMIYPDLAKLNKI